MGERLQRAGMHIHLELIQAGVQQKADTTLHVSYTPIKESVRIADKTSLLSLIANEEFLSSCGQYFPH